jgi:hypothetical protein
MRVSAPSRISGLKPLRWRSALTSSNARRSSLVAATETAAAEAEYEDEETLAEFEGDEALATSRGLSRDETPCVDVEMRRATGLGWFVRSLGFGSSLPFAETAAVARPRDDARMIA